VVVATHGLATRWPLGTLGFVALLVVVSAGPAWLWHAASTLRDLAKVPDRLDSRPELKEAHADLEMPSNSA
jgi:hypothetical protein